MDPDDVLKRHREERDKARKQWAKQKWTANLGDRKIVREFKCGESARGFIVEMENPTWEAYQKVPSLRAMYDARGPVHQYVYNGYAMFKKRPCKEPYYDGILTYVPAPGGITYAEQWKDGFVYGFDTMHAGDEARPELRDLDYLENRVRLMAATIEIAARFEDAYIEAGDDNAAKAAVIDEYHETLKISGLGEFELQNNFGAMLSLLMGKL